MECEKCLSPWDTETHIPKILACGHTICQNCIYEISKQLLSKEEKLFKCPICNYEIMTITTTEDVLDLKKNLSLINLVDKVTNTKNRSNISNNISMSMSARLNTSSFLVNDSSMNMNSNYETKVSNICFYPVCKIHQNKAYFNYFKNNEKKYVCLYCLENNIIQDSEKLIPLPSLNVQNDLKIKACKKKSKLLIREIEKIQLFLENYHQKFESENKQKIEDLFRYIKKIVDYNHTTALTLYNQCRNEQKTQIDKNLKELVFLREELDSFNQKLDEIANEDLNKDKINPDTQLQLEKIYNRLGNYINYENQLSLFQMDININEEVKDSLFDLIQNAYRINIEFIKMKNGDLPKIKDLLKKSTSWPCSCGQEDNDINKILCSNCSRYRSLETYNNILFNPLIANNQEIKYLEIRRNHEKKVFLSLIKRNTETTKNEKNYRDISFYVIDNTWFNKWKAFVSNDLTDKVLPNDMKYISDNKKIGVLPPDIIDNSKICTINNVKSNDNSNGEICKYKLKKGLKLKKDYIIINQYLWEWLLVNYNGGPEIKLSDKIINPLAPIHEKNEMTLNDKFVEKKDGNKRNSIKQRNSVFNHINKNKNKNNINKNKNNNTINYNLKNTMNSHNHNHKPKNKIISNTQTKKICKTLTFGDEYDQNSSDLESSDFEDKSKSVSLDVSSNKINPVNVYTFNAKFCDFNNNNKQQKKECFEDIEFIIDEKYNEIDMLDFRELDNKMNK